MLTPTAAPRSIFITLCRLVRVRQWVKNVLIFAGLVFAGRLRMPDGVGILGAELLRVIVAFVCFCALSGAIYVINDWCDAPRDRLHPLKKNRPIASGEIGGTQAAMALVALLAVAVVCVISAIYFEPKSVYFSMSAAGYFALMLLYSLVLKHHVIVDVLCVAMGFVLRVAAGCLVIPVYISPWILLCTFNCALFVALCKRRAELAAMGNVAYTRKVLLEYSFPLLDPLIAASAALAVMTYSLYTFNASHAAALGTLQNTSLLMLTIPLVVYSIFRYWFLALNTEVGEAPEKMLFDIPLLISAGLWGLTVVILTILAGL